MRSILKSLQTSLLKVFYPSVPMSVLMRWPWSRVLLMGIFQRILRVNAGVSWPVHWSSLVSNANNIDRKFPDWATPGFNIGQYIQAKNGLVLGKHVRMGPGVKIVSADHDLCDYDKHLPADAIVIGNYCWLGANSIILAGVELADHTVVAAGAVVTKSVLQGDCVVAGVPARVVKSLPPYHGKTRDKA